MRLQEHFRQAEMQRIRTLPGHVPMPQAERFNTGRASTRLLVHTEAFR